MRALSPAALDFLREYVIASLTLVRPDGSPHVTPVGFTWDDGAGLARVITDGGSQKARFAGAGGGTRAALCQVDGGRWLTLEGTTEVSTDPVRVQRAVDLYGQRYRQPRVNPNRVVVEITVDRILGAASLLA